MKTLVFALLVGVSAVAQAAVIYPKTQARSIQAALDIAGTPYVTNVSAANFNTFSNSVAFAGGGRFEPYWVQATQDSQIGGSSITASGGANVGLANGLVGNANAQSDFKIKFRLLQPVTFSLVGQLVWNEIGTLVVESPWVRLSDAHGVIFQTEAAPLDATPLDYSTNATLLPGDYVLEAHAGVTNDFANGAEKSFTLDFNVTPTGPAVAGFGSVYQLSGAFEGVILSGGRLLPLVVLPHDLALAGLGLPSNKILVNQWLALVSDSLDHSLRFVVWDKSSAAVVAELGTLEIQASLLAKNSYAATADWMVPSVGRLVDAFGDVVSRVTFSPRGALDDAGVATQFTAYSAVGQLNLLDNAGVKTNTVLIRSGSLVAGRKLGTTP